MARTYDAKLELITELVGQGLNPASTAQIMKHLGSDPLSTEELRSLRLYNETLPKADEFPHTEHSRFAHFLWDLFDKLPLCLAVPFSIPFRRLLAETMFASCGKGFVCEENVRFNFPQLISVGDGVFFNRNVFLDSKGGIEIGDFSALAEDVQIYTHGHSESSHLERTYSKVAVGAYAKVYSGAVLMPGVTVGAEAIVAARALVNKDVAPGMVVAGVPAKVIRERDTKGRHGEDLDHIWLF